VISSMKLSQFDLKNVTLHMLSLLVYIDLKYKAFFSFWFVSEIFHWLL
jgi:hypothetical protein